MCVCLCVCSTLHFLGVCFATHANAHPRCCHVTPVAFQRGPLPLGGGVSLYPKSQVAFTYASILCVCVFVSIKRLPSRPFIYCFTRPLECLYDCAGDNVGWEASSSDSSRKDLARLCWTPQHGAQYKRRIFFCHAAVYQHDGGLIKCLRVCVCFGSRGCYSKSRVAATSHDDGIQYALKIIEILL